ncbi:hypothetical protein QE152_g25816 [Popillia japonica]|uniref:Uncharacterized protein n=1 Tax=Popillia japonica TaxID=7064 RepID=A0AAW1K0R1_POPJA
MKSNDSDNEYEEIFKTSSTSKNVELFNSSLGKIKNYQVKLHIKENAKPIHIAARPIKFGIQKNVEAELERLVKQGTISPVDPNKTPIENVELFNSSLGKIKNYQVKLHIKENAKPIHIAA